MIPVHLDIRNFFSHKHSEVDFTKFDAALLIGNTEGDYDLSNGSGKSAIFESVLWCLFNKARVAAMDDIILWGEESCSVTLEFIQEGVRYKVIRERSRVRKLATVAFSYLSEDDDWIDISGSTSTLTNDKIISILKFDYKTFVNSAYFRQNDISEFAESDPGRKKEILKSIIDLSKWDEYEKEAKARRKNIRSECEILEAKISELDLDEVELAKANNRLKELKRELDLYSQKNKENSESLELVQNRYQEIKRSLDTDQWDKIVAENSEINVKIERLATKKSSAEKTVRVAEKKIEPIRSQITELELKLSEIVVDKEIDEKMKKVRDSQVIYRSKLATANNMIQMLDKKDIEEEVCNVCGQDISEDLHSQLLHSHNEERDKYKKDVVFATNKIEESNTLIKKFEKVQKDNKRASLFKSKINSLNSELEINMNLLSEKREELEHTISDLRSLENKKKDNLSVLDSLKNDDFQKLHVEIDKRRDAGKNFTKLIADKNREIGVLSQQIKTLGENIESMRKDKKEFVKLNKKRAAYEKLSKLLGKNGIQTILLNAVIEDLEKTANQILVSICNEPLTILLETQRVGSDGVSLVDTLDLKVKKDGITQNFKSLSGGEQFRISLSLRIALSEISSRHGGSSLEFLLLDEINSPLDRHGTENLFVNVIRSLEKKYKLLVITHNDSLKEKFMNVIDITKVNGESSTLFTQK